MEDNDTGYGCLYKVMLILGIIGILGMLIILANEGSTLM